MFGNLRKRASNKRGAEYSRDFTFAGGTRDLRDLVAPDGFLVSPSHIQIGSGRFVRSYAVSMLPSEVMVGWLDGLYNVGDVDISFHIVPGENRAVVEELSNKLAMLDAQNMLDEKNGDYRFIPLRAAEGTDINQLRLDIQTNRNKMMYVSILFTVAADNIEQLEKKARLLESVLAGSAVHVRQAFLRQPEGLRSVSPIGDIQLTRVYRNLDLGASTTLMPFLGSDLTHENGVLLGINETTGGPVFYNAFAGPPLLTNPHMALIATSGAGKTTLVKMMSARSALLGIRTVFVDPEGEYGSLVRGAGGVYIRLVPGGKVYLNPFEIEADEQEGRQFVNVLDKIADLKGLVAVMVEGAGEKIKPEEIAIVEEVVAEEYASRGIDDNPGNLYVEETGLKDGVYVSRKVKKRMPTLSSFYSRLQTKGEVAERLLLLLKPYLAGGSMGLFDGESDINLKDAPFVAFDVSKLEERFLRPFAMYVVLGWIWEEFVKADRKARKRVVVDEAWTMMKYKQTADFLETMARRARKYGTSLCVSTQNFMEFASSNQGLAVITNLDSLILMQQNPKELDTVSEVFRLSAKQRDFLRTAGVGQALLRAGRQAVAFTAEVAPFEWEFLKGVA
ncbi:MAG: ATP-binding protein [Firmicutes bacterium]|jgi:type IV secretory pathway VirB4 component|nr:ATP-binding protein [Bacillota bacterium]